MARPPGEPRSSLSTVRAGLLGALAAVMVVALAAMVMLIPTQSPAKIALLGSLAAILGSMSALLAVIRRGERA